MFNKRSDGIKIVEEDEIVKAGLFFMGPRSESTNFYTNPVRCEPIDRLIESEKQKGIKFTYTHIVIATLVRLLYLRPKLNYFINHNIAYIHKDITITMNVKKVLKDNGAEIALKMPFTGRESVYEIKEKIDRYIASVLEKGAEVDGTTKTAKTLNRLPKWLFRSIMGMLKFLDRHNSLPKSLIKDSSFHCSIYLTNLKSLKLDAIHHHLYNFGTCSLFVAMGKERIAPVVEGNKEIKMGKVINLGLSMDDRIADGFYYGKSLRIWRNMFENLDKLKDSMQIDYLDEFVKNKKRKN